MRIILFLVIIPVLYCTPQSINAKNIIPPQHPDTTQTSLDKKSRNDDIDFSQIKDLFDSKLLKVKGYALLRSIYDTHDQGRISRHDYRVRSVAIDVTGEITNKFRYNLLIEAAVPQVQNLWAEFTPSKYFNLRAGQFSHPLALEIHCAPGVLEYSESARPIQHLMGYSDDPLIKREGGKSLSFGRDIGIQAHGTALEYKGRKILDYALALLQGSGINTKDPDNRKDFAAVLTVYPIEGMRIRGGAHFGSATYDNADGQGEAVHVRNRYAVGAEYLNGRFKYRFEYIRGKDGAIDRHGLYGVTIYDIVPQKVNTLVMVGYYDNNIELKGQHQEAMDYTAGFNYYIATLTRVQLVYKYSTYSRGWKTDYTDNHRVTAQLQIGF